MASRSKRIKGSPALTWASCWVSSVNPSPFILTVSKPMWMSTSAPLLSSRPIAWSELSMIMETVASAGATMVSPDGLIATPSPIIFCEKASSGTSLMSTRSPETKAFSFMERSSSSTEAMDSAAGAAGVSAEASFVSGTVFSTAAGISPFMRASKWPRTLGTDRPTMTWMAWPFLTRPKAPALVNLLVAATLSGSLTVTRRRVAQLVTSRMLSGPPRQSRKTWAFRASAPPAMPFFSISFLALYSALVNNLSSPPSSVRPGVGKSK